MIYDRFRKNKKNNKTEEKNEIIRHELGNQIVYYNQNNFSQLKCNEFAKEIINLTNYEDLSNKSNPTDLFYVYESTSDEMYIQRVKTRIINLLLAWENKCPNDANYILAVISIDNYDILSDDDIDRLKIKADSLNPIDESLYPIFLSLLTTKNKINQLPGLLLRPIGNVNYFDTDYNELKLKNTIKLCDDVVYIKQKYENSFHGSIKNNGVMKLEDIVQDDNVDLINRFVAYSCLTNLGYTGYKELESEFKDNYLDFYLQTIIFKLKNSEYNSEL